MMNDNNGMTGGNADRTGAWRALTEGKIGIMFDHCLIIIAEASIVLRLFLNANYVVSYV